MRGLHDTFGSREWTASIGAPTTYSGLDPGKRGRFTLPMMDDRRYRKRRPGRQILETNWLLTVKGEHAGGPTKTKLWGRPSFLVTCRAPEVDHFELQGRQATKNDGLPYFIFFAL